ncbi:VG15 protein [Actinosynnema sp. NPDC004786]
MPTTDRGRQLLAAQRAAQLALRARLLAELLDLWALLDPVRLDDTTQPWLRSTTDTVLRYRNRSARSAVDFYAELRSAELPAAEIGTAVVPEVPEIDPPTVARVQASLVTQGPIEVRARLVVGEDPQDAAEAALTAVQGAAARHALNGGRQALVAAGERDERAKKYARVTTSADPCWFCRMLAARGFVYPTEDAAGARKNRRFDGDGLYKFHDWCACGVEPVFVEDAPPSPAAQANADLWDRATKGLGGERARAAFRRAVEGRSLPDDPINLG